MDNLIGCVGKVAIDIFYYVPKIYIAENHISNEVSTSLGGKTANVAVALSKLGISPSLFSSIGKDENGSFALNRLKRWSIYTENVKQFENEKTSFTFTVVEKDGKNTMFHYPGVLEYFSLSSEEYLKLQKAALVFVQADIPSQVLKQILEMCTNVFLELTIPIEISKRVKYVSLNEDELREITKTSDIRKGLEKLHNQGCENIFLKLGEKGSIYYNGKDLIKKPAYKVKVIDTTGAGDSFSAGLIYSLLNNYTIEKALDFATRCSALTVSRKGTEESFPNLEEVLSFKC